MTKIVLPGDEKFLLHINKASFVGTGHSFMSKNQVRENGIKTNDDPYFGDLVIHTRESYGVDLPLSFEDGVTFMTIATP